MKAKIGSPNLMHLGKVNDGTCELMSMSPADANQLPRHDSFEKCPFQDEKLLYMITTGDTN